jgi:hypothetical protein
VAAIALVIWAIGWLWLLGQDPVSKANIDFWAITWVIGIAFLAYLSVWERRDKE